MPKRPSSAPHRTPARGTNRGRAETVQRMLALLKQGSDSRSGMIRRVRRSIAAGTYINGLKLDVAVERLMGEL